METLLVLTKANPNFPKGFDSRSVLGRLRIDDLVQISADSYKVDKDELYGYYHSLPYSMDLIFGAIATGFSSFLKNGAVRNVVIYYPHIVCFPRFNSLHTTYYYRIEYGNGSSEFTYLCEMRDGLETESEINDYAVSVFNGVMRSIQIDTDIYHYSPDYPKDSDITNFCINHINKLFIKENFGYSLDIAHGKGVLVSVGTLEGASSVFSSKIGLLKKATITADINNHAPIFAIDSHAWNVKGDVDYDEYCKIAFDFIPKFTVTRYLLARLIRLLKKKPRAYREAEMRWIKEALLAIKNQYSLSFDKTIEVVLTEENTNRFLELSKNIGAFAGQFYKATVLDD